MAKYKICSVPGAKWEQIKAEKTGGLDVRETTVKMIPVVDGKAVLRDWTYAQEFTWVDPDGNTGTYYVIKGGYVDPRARLFNGAVVEADRRIVMDHLKPCDLDDRVEAVAPCDIYDLINAGKVDPEKVIWVCNHCRTQLDYIPMSLQFRCEHWDGSGCGRIAHVHKDANGYDRYPSGSATYPRFWPYRGEAHNTFHACHVPGAHDYKEKLAWLSKATGHDEEDLHMGKCEDIPLMKLVVEVCIAVDPYCHRSSDGEYIPPTREEFAAWKAAR